MGSRSNCDEKQLCCGRRADREPLLRARLSMMLLVLITRLWIISIISTIYRLCTDQDSLVSRESTFWATLFMLVAALCLDTAVLFWNCTFREYFFEVVSLSSAFPFPLLQTLFNETLFQWSVFISERKEADIFLIDLQKTVAFINCLGNYSWNLACKGAHDCRNM